MTMKEEKQQFRSLMIWDKTGKLVDDLVDKKGFSIAKTMHKIILAAHKLNFPEVYNDTKE